MKIIKQEKGNMHNQRLVFLISLIIFCIAAGYGWEKLHYGFNFIDEGFHMTESWRLTVGDPLLEDKHYGDPLRLYSVFNALIFEIAPGIELLEFRKLQYVFTILSLLIFGFAIAKLDQQYWYLPLVFSLFAFNGLLPWGIIPNLNYYTYFHLFLVLHLSFLLLGLYQHNILAKRILYIASGLSMWGISFSLLHTGVIILSPILLLIIQKKFNFQTFSFTFKDLCFLLAPFFILWIIFVAIYRETYILSALSSVNYFLSYYQPERIKLLTDLKKGIALWCMGITFIYVALSFWVLKKLPGRSPVIGLMILSLLMLVTVINLFRAPEDLASITMPTWYSTMLISFLIIFWFEIIKGYFRSHRYSRHEELSIILLIPASILSIIMTLFSYNGIWNFMLSSIPITAAVSIYLLYQTKLKREPHVLKAICLALFFLPFYYGIVWYTVKVPYFDEPVFSSQTVEIEAGFGKGVKTSMKNKKIHDLILAYADKYSNANDYIIAYPDSPMVYMIAKRRPSLNSSWTTFLFYHPDDLNGILNEEIELMKRKNRRPKMAFVLSSTFSVFRNLPTPEDNPLTRYVSENMVQLNRYENDGEFVLSCWIDKKFWK